MKVVRPGGIKARPPHVHRRFKLQRGGDLCAGPCLAAQRLVLLFLIFASHLQHARNAPNDLRARTCTSAQPVQGLGISTAGKGSTRAAAPLVSRFKVGGPEHMSNAPCRRPASSVANMDR